MEAVLRVVEAVPPGRVTTYGAVAAHLAATGMAGRPVGARTVGRLMSLHGGGVPWWRVVRADGSLPEPLQREAAAAYAREGTPVHASGRVEMRVAWWDPGRTSAG